MNSIPTLQTRKRKRKYPFVRVRPENIKGQMSCKKVQNSFDNQETIVIFAVQFTSKCEINDFQTVNGGIFSPEVDCAPGCLNLKLTTTLDRAIT